MLVKPENRLVANNHERQWNEELIQLARAEEEYTGPKGRKPEISQQKTNPGSSIRFAPGMEGRTCIGTRPQAYARLIVGDITLVREKMIQIQIRWKGGATPSLQRPLPQNVVDMYLTPVSIVKQVRVLAASKTDSQIAKYSMIEISVRVEVNLSLDSQSN